MKLRDHILSSVKLKSRPNIRALTVTAQKVFRSENGTNIVNVLIREMIHDRLMMKSYWSKNRLPDENGVYCDAFYLL